MMESFAYDMRLSSLGHNLQDLAEVTHSNLFCWGICSCSFWTRFMQKRHCRTRDATTGILSRTRG